MAVKKGKSNEAEILVHQDYYFDKNKSNNDTDKNNNVEYIARAII